MKLIGFNFTKINAEKLNNLTQAPKVSNSIDISEIKEVKSKLFDSKENPIEISFVYEIKYEPAFATLSFSGNLIFLLESKESKDLIKKWKNKELSNDFKSSIFNIILKKTNIKAAQLEDELNLPIHFQMPSIKIQEDSERKKN